MSANAASPRQFILGLADELIVDLFAGGGGMSVAIEQVFGRHADIACNHDDDALSMHRANHPQTRHFQCDVYEVDPRTVCRGRPVGLLHLSPDCTHHSQAAGGQPRDRKIRALSWVGVRWAGQVRPRVITLENVKQIRQWGPLVAKRDPATGRVLKLDGSVAARGERVPLEQQYLVPDKKRQGQTWKRFNAVFRSMGYEVGEELLIAANHRAATTRERLMWTGRRDGEPIGRGEVTHHRKPTRGQKRWRAAAEHLDFSLPCPSIFERKKPLAEATCRRIAKGVQRYVLGAAEPFIVNNLTNNVPRPVSEPTQPLLTGQHKMLVSPVLAGVGGPEYAGKPASAAQPLGTMLGESHRAIIGAHLQQLTQGGRNHSVEDPLSTVTTAKGGEQMVVAPTLLKIRGSSDGGNLVEPLPTITSGAGAKRPAGHPHAMGIVAPVLVQAAHGEGKPDGVKRWGNGSRSAESPVGTVTASGGHAVAGATLVAGFLAQHNTMPNGGVHPGHDLREPASTITGTGSQQGMSSASLVTLRRNCDGRPVDDPLPTLTAGAEHHAVLECRLSPEHEAGALRVAAFLIRYHGTGGQWADCRDPLTTLTAKERLALVTVVIKGTPYVIFDIGLRMLTPREAYGCQGFPADYIIERGHDGRRFSKSAQFRMCGNSVSPPMGVAHLRAQFPELAVIAGKRKAAA